MSQASASQNGIFALFGKGWFWFSNITSVVGLISIIDDLKLWIATAAQIIAWVQSAIPGLAEALLAVGRAIHVVLEIFRALARPLFDLLFGWLHIQVPQMAKDAVIVAIFVALGLVRVGLKAKADYRNARNLHLADIKRKAEAFGFAYDDSAAFDVSVAAGNFNTLNSPYMNEENKAYSRKRLDEAVARFGPKLEPFLQAHPEIYHHDAYRGWVQNQTFGTWFVWIAAGITALLVVLDAILMR
jgi:hypothetical protein